VPLAIISEQLNAGADRAAVPPSVLATADEVID
jgi:hypothetical protein